MLPEVATPDLSFLLTYGPLGIFAAVALYFALRYGPRLFEAHINHVKTTTDTQERLTTAFETLTESNTVNAGNHTKTHRALDGIAEGLRVVVPPDHHKHLDKAQDALK